MWIILYDDKYQCQLLEWIEDDKEEEECQKK